MDAPLPVPPPDDPPRAVPVRYEFLDALRGWAFLGVLATHCGMYMSGDFRWGNVTGAGRYGVQLFFLISAFTIFLTLDRAQRSGRHGWTEFFIRRFFRILPMFWVGIALYCFAPGRLATYVNFPFTPLDYFLTATLQHGWHPALINSIVPGGWSIAVEGTFYLLAPFCHRVVRHWQAALWLLLGSLALAQFADSTLGGAYMDKQVFVGMSMDQMLGFVGWWFPTQLPVFACGILVYHVAVATDNLPRNRATGAVLLAVAALALHAAVGIGQQGWIGEHVFFSLAFVPLIFGLRAWPAGLLVNRVTRFLGRISYSAYLLHFLVLHLTDRSLGVLLPPAWMGTPPEFLLLFGVALVGTAALAWLAWRCVEQPCIGLGARLIQYRRANHAGTALVAPGHAA